MACYSLGSVGPEIKKIQQRLKTLGCYQGIVDANFGGITKSAVESFQKGNRLEIDGKVGPLTWRRLFAGEITDPAIALKPLAYRCLALTGSFETGKGVPDCFSGLSGDFDGQGISFGVLQWNFGQKSLQPLLREMFDQHHDVARSVFRDQYDILATALESSQSEIMQFARAIQQPVKRSINEPWRGMFVALGQTPEFQKIEQKYADATFQSALKLCADYDLRSERASALMFDIRTQNGSIASKVKKQILTRYAALPKSLSADDLEVRKMRVVANCRAEAAKPEWVEDVRARKLCCANGVGLVHGIDFNLENQYGIRLTSVA